MSISLRRGRPAGAGDALDLGLLALALGSRLCDGCQYVRFATPLTG